MALRDWRPNCSLLLAFICFLKAVRSSDMVHERDISDVGGNASEGWQVFLSSSFDQSWCIAKEHVKPDAVQEGLDWACGFGGADCLPIQLGNACFLPNTVYGHASYAFNSYYQVHQHASGTCDFDGVATVTYEDPSYPGCSYPYRVGQAGVESKGSRRCINAYSAFSGAVVVLFMLM